MCSKCASGLLVVRFWVILQIVQCQVTFSTIPRMAIELVQYNTSVPLTPHILVMESRYPQHS